MRLTYRGSDVRNKPAAQQSGRTLEVSGVIGAVGLGLAIWTTGWLESIGVALAVVFGGGALVDYWRKWRASRKRRANRPTG
jgi:hypothetical protein